MASQEPLLDEEAPAHRPAIRSQVTADSARAPQFKKLTSSSRKPNGKRTLVEQTEESWKLFPHKRSILRIEKEAEIQSSKPQLANGLAEALEGDAAREFKTLARRIDSTICAWYKGSFEELLHLYQVFDPLDGGERIRDFNLTEVDVEKLELRFLRMLFRVMDNSNYKMVTDQEYDVAKQGTYLLSLPISVDEEKLDKGLFGRFFAKHPKPDLPSFTDKFVIFRRGVGIDQSTSRFIIPKIDMILNSIWYSILVMLCIKKPKDWKDEINDTRSETDQEPDYNVLTIERVHLENMRLSFAFLFSANTIQEPTFERIILLYRPATSPDSDVGDRAICIKHFRHIPMADMEIVLPEKLTPGLTPRDWISMAMTLIFGLIAVISAARANAGLHVYIAIGVACATYILKLYLAWNASMKTYRSLIQDAMYDKQLDSGRGTLLHLCDDVLQQEWKEVLVAYFMLLKSGRATKEELDRRCEMYMDLKFGENVQFEVEDAVAKLLRLGLAKQLPDGKFVHVPLPAAAASIGLTTDERFGSHDKHDFQGEEDVRTLIGDVSDHFTFN